MASPGSRWRSREMATCSCASARSLRCSAGRAATSKPVLLPLAIMLPEDTFALTEQLLKANNVWHNHVVAHACVARQTTLNLTRGHRLQSRILAEQLRFFEGGGDGISGVPDSEHAAHGCHASITMVELSLPRRRPRCVAVRCAVRFLSFCGGRCAACRCFSHNSIN